MSVTHDRPNCVHCLVAAQQQPPQYVVVVVHQQRVIGPFDSHSDAPAWIDASGVQLVPPVRLERP